MPSATAHTRLAGLISFLVRTLEARGFDRMAMLREAGIDPAQLDLPDARLPCTQVERLWQLAMAASANDLTIALDTALRYDVDALHVLGFGLQACSDLVRATERLARASAIFNTGLRASSSCAAGQIAFAFDYLYPGAPRPWRLIADGDFDKASVARGMHMSERTLQRRLLAENLGFMQLLTGTRRDLARTHLGSGRLTIREVAYLLGYSDPANFSRAFRGWFGVAPDVFRQGEAARILFSRMRTHAHLVENSQRFKPARTHATPNFFCAR